MHFFLIFMGKHTILTVFLYPALYNIYSIEFLKKRILSMDMIYIDSLTINGIQFTSIGILIESVIISNSKDNRQSLRIVILPNGQKQTVMMFAFNGTLSKLNSPASFAGKTVFVTGYYNKGYLAIRQMGVLTEQEVEDVRTCSQEGFQIEAPLFIASLERKVNNAEEG